MLTQSFKSFNACILCMLIILVFTGNAWGTETTVYTFATSQSTRNTAYDSNYDVTISSKSWSVPGNQNFSGYVRIGGKNLTEVNRVIKSNDAISGPITKITLSHGGKSNKSLTVNSIKLEVASNSDFSTIISTETQNPTINISTEGTVTFTPPSSLTSWPNNSYYRITINVSNSTNKNYGLDVKSIAFVKETFTVSYNNNGGSGTMTDASSPYVKGSTVTVKSNTFTRSGFDFTEWNTVSDGSGTSYDAGATFSIGANTTLYAQWETAASCSNEITITKGTPSNGSFSLSQTGAVCIDDENASVTVTGITPSAGYRFKEITSSGGGTINNTAKTVTDISANTTINVVFEQIPSHKAYFYNGSTLLNTGGTSFQEGASVSYGGSTPVSCDTGDGASTTFVGWATSTWAGKVAKASIVPDFYESTLPVMGEEDVTYHAVFAKVSSASELFSWAGGSSSGLTNTTGVSASGLGSDYAASNSPYLVKLDDTGDYIIITTSAAIGSVAVDVKMIGGASTSTLTVKESTAADGTFTDVEALSISGSQNDVLNLSTSNAFKSTSRAVKLLFTKGSNVGVGPITITGVPSGSNYMTTCCTSLGQINGPLK